MVRCWPAGEFSTQRTPYARCADSTSDMVATGYQVVVPDYRGASASSKPRDGYDKRTMAGDLHHLVRNELGIDGAISIVGHDLGSMVAFAYSMSPDT
jgi:pimeloyl-ACP methyl ester carboxylesterase